MCHGTVGYAQIECSGQLVDDARAVLGQRGERSRRPAELDGQSRLGKLAQTPPRIEKPDEPACRNEAERRRHRLLEQRPRRHRRAPVSPCEPRALLGGSVDVAQDVRDALPGDEHRSSVEDVLARRAEVDELLVLVPDARAQRADERLDRVPHRASLVDQLVPAECVRLGAHLGDHLGGRGGDSPHRGARRGERALHVEHRPQPRLPRDGIADRGGDEQGVERGHTAKNVVCAGPCKRMSNRSPPSSGTATSVSRCDGERAARTGSAAFADTSSGK